MDDLKLIKKHYGENMMHLCRELFPTILEEQGKLFKILEEHFDYSKYLYDDIINNNLQYKFKNYIYSLCDMEIVEQEITKTPQKLMDEAGYILYECKTYKEVEQFKKYYKLDEELCTFRDIEDRLKTNYVFFAVKKDVDQIRREEKPNRQDKYGTSVISIQFTKGEVNTLSIKNRYNHTVSNPDATFSNNLENIKEGLTESFNKEYKLNINSTKSNFEIPNYVLANDGKFYKYNYEINNIYYCPNNIIIDNFEVKKYDKERYIVLDYFILDMKEKNINMKEKNIKIYGARRKDSFIDGLQDINKIEIRKLNDEKEIIINEDIIITINNLNQIIGYENTHIYTLGGWFLYFNETLKKIKVPNVEHIGDHVLSCNKELEKIDLSKATNIGNCFLYKNRKLKEIEVPNVYYIGTGVLSCNEELEKIDLSTATHIGDSLLYCNKTLKKIKVPNVEHIGDYVLSCNKELEKIDLSKVTYIGDRFLQYNKKLKEIEVPNVNHIGYYVLENNEELEKIDLSKATNIGCRFLQYNKKLKEFKAPILNNMRSNCLDNILELEVFDVPEHIKEQFNIKEVKSKVKLKVKN